MPTQRRKQTKTPGESLAVALELVARRADLSLDSIAFTALLGLGAAVTADPKACLRTWPAVARDAVLDRTGNLVGIQLRELHPPSASAGLERSAEFPQHFIDSYVPLINRALEADQQVLAWRGWPAPHQTDWGLITQRKGKQLIGHAGISAETALAEKTPLPDAAYQVYVVERVDPTIYPNRPAVESYEHVVKATCEFWDGSLVADRRVFSGQRAYTALMETLNEEAICPRCEVFGTTCLAQVIQHLIAARTSLRAWLAKTGEALTPPHSLTAHRWGQTCEAVVARLQPYTDPARLDEMITLATGRQEVAGAIELAAGMENAMFETLV